MAQGWNDLVVWLTRDPEWLGGFEANAFFFLLDLLLVAVALPFWLGWLERRRWRSMRRKLVRAAFAAHKACSENAVALSRQFFRENSGAPLERLSRVRKAIEKQRADGQRFYQKTNVFSAAIDASHADLLTSTIDYCDLANLALSQLTRLYLKEATVRVAPNVVHGEDLLGYPRGQVVSLRHVADLESLAAAFAEKAEENRALLAKAMGRRERRAQAAEFDRAAQNVEALRADIGRFCAGLQPLDPDCATYRSRAQNDRGPRTLDALIARFDRSGVMAV